MSFYLISRHLASFEDWPWKILFLSQTEVVRLSFLLCLKKKFIINLQSGLSQIYTLNFKIKPKKKLKLNKKLNKTIYKFHPFNPFFPHQCWSRTLYQHRSRSLIRSFLPLSWPLALLFPLSLFPYYLHAFLFLMIFLSSKRSNFLCKVCWWQFL